MIDNSPRTIAAFHVLHRRNVPRHPPCAPTTNNNKKATQNPTTHTTKLCAQRSKNKPDKIQKEKITRVHYPVLTQHTHTTTNHHTPRQPPAARPGTTTMCHPRHPTMHQRTPTLCVSHTPPTTRYRYPMIMMPHTNNRVPKQAIHPQKQTISAHQPPATCDANTKKNKAP